jgi:GDP-L-fucose synthase
LSETSDLFADERVLVTGSGGVLGTALTGLLRSMRLAALACPGRADCDLLDEAAVTALWRRFRPTLVFHLAGLVAGVGGNLSFSGPAFYQNAKINLNVIEASRLVGARKLVAAGSTAIYSDTVSIPMREDDLWLGPPHSSEAAYAHAKRAMLAHLQAYRHQYGLEFAYLICTNLYGPADRFDERYGHVVPSLIKRFYDARTQGQKSITVWGDGSPSRDFLYADDAARGFLAAAGGGSGPLNLATGRVCTIRNLVDALQEVSGYAGFIRWDPTRPNGQLARGYDVSRMHALGWQPTVGLLDGLRRTYEWYARHHGESRRSISMGGATSTPGAASPYGPDTDADPPLE